MVGMLRLQPAGVLVACWVIAPVANAGPALACDANAVWTVRDDCVGGGYSFSAISNETTFYNHSCGQWILQNHPGNTRVRVRWWYTLPDGTEKDIIPEVVLASCAPHEECNPFGVERIPLYGSLQPRLTSTGFGLYLGQYADDEVQAAIHSRSNAPVSSNPGDTYAPGSNDPGDSSHSETSGQPADVDLVTNASGLLSTSDDQDIPIELGFRSSLVEENVIVN